MSDTLFKFEGISGIILVYEDRITIDRNNKYARQLKIPEKTCPIIELKGIALTEGKKSFLTIENGWIKLDLPTNQTIQRRLFLTNNEVMDENKVFFKPDSNQEAVEFKKKLEDYMISIKNKSSTTSVQSSADEILKFKQLLDLGIISQEEFNKKKKEFLGL